MVGGEPLDLIGILGPHIDLLIAEHQRRARLALAWIEHLHLHAEYRPVPFGGPRDVGDVDHEVIESMNFDRHSSSFRRDAILSPRRGAARAPHWPPAAKLVTTRSATNSTRKQNWRKSQCCHD